MHCLTRSPHLIFGIPSIPPEEEEETSWEVSLMEDHRVLKASVDDSIRDSIQEMKDSIRKDLTEFRSMLLEVLGGKAMTSFEPQNTVTNPKLWQFRGKNPEAWIVQAEHYFDFYKIEEDQKLNVALFYLEGEALKWYQWLFRNNQLIDWLHFADKVRIRFKQKEYESTEGRFTNLGQLPYVIEYQNCCEDRFGESDILFPGRTYVHPRWSNITNSLLSQHHGEQSGCKSNTSARKVFGESSDIHKDAHSLGTSSKPIELFIPPNDLVSSISKVNSCGDDVKNEDKNDEEEIVSIINKPIELVIANADKHSFWINYIVSTPCNLSIFYIRKALDDRRNQLFAYPFGLALRWEVMPSISFTFNHAMLMSKVTNDGRDYVGCYIIFSLDMCPKLVECDGYDLKCLVSRSNLVGNGIILHVWDPGIHRQLMKLNHLNSGILFHAQTQDILVNAKQLKRPVCALTVHQGESFLVGGGIEKRVVRRWNSQKLDHQQIFEIVRQKHEPVLARWITERCGIYRWVEDLDDNNKIKCSMCHIIVHQDFHGLSNIQNLVSCFYPACAKLEFK